MANYENENSSQTLTYEELNRNWGLQVEEATRSIASALAVIPEFAIMAANEIKIAIEKEAAGGSNKIISGLTDGVTWFDSGEEGFLEALRNTYAVIQNAMENYQYDQFGNTVVSSELALAFENICFNYNFLFLGPNKSGVVAPIKIGNKLAQLNDLANSAFNDLSTDGILSMLGELEASFDAATFVSEFDRFEEKFNEINKLKEESEKFGLSCTSAYIAANRFAKAIDLHKAACSKLVDRNLSAAYKIAGQWARKVSNKHHEDIAGLAMQLAYDSAVRFSPRKAAFTTYMANRAQHIVGTHVKEASEIVSIPTSSINIYKNVSRFQAEFKEMNGRAASMDELKQAFPKQRQSTLYQVVSSRKGEYIELDRIIDGSDFNDFDKRFLIDSNLIELTSSDDLEDSLIKSNAEDHIEILHAEARKLLDEDEKSYLDDIFSGLTKSDIIRNNGIKISTSRKYDARIRRAYIQVAGELGINAYDAMTHM